MCSRFGQAYAYSAYGETVALGPDGGNPLQYTGRENDGTGLYYYRARYYDPLLKRFIAEDPIGTEGGINLYAYVGGNPISYVDPLGLQAIPVPGGGLGGLGGLGGFGSRNTGGQSSGGTGSRELDEAMGMGGSSSSSSSSGTVSGSGSAQNDECYDPCKAAQAALERERALWERYRLLPETVRQFNRKVMRHNAKCPKNKVDFLPLPGN
jgi:RHS repeat-associated protein